ncbi:MAG: DUF2244 domain-containing protein [Pseudomonadota bacterium]
MVVYHNEEEAGADASASFPEDAVHSGRGAPSYSVTLWPNRSLSANGLRAVMGITGVGLLIPLIPFLGTPVAWGLIPFLVAALFAVYAAFMRSYRDGRLHEVLRLWPDLITVERVDPKGRTQSWQANPFWVELKMHSDARVENYITLRGSGRTIELGAFLAPEEREALHAELETALRQCPR